MHKLRFQHSIKTLCRVLRVNRSTYYKHFHSDPAPRAEENQKIRKQILQIYAAYNKRLGAYKTRSILERDHGICVSVGRVHHLMQDMDLPKMSTDKPTYHRSKVDNKNYTNHLKQQFPQKAPNLVWTSDLTYIKTGRKWYHLCVVIDLFSPK